MPVGGFNQGESNKGSQWWVIISWVDRMKSIVDGRLGSWYVGIVVASTKKRKW